MAWVRNGFVFTSIPTTRRCFAAQADRAQPFSHRRPRPAGQPLADVRRHLLMFDDTWTSGGILLSAVEAARVVGSAVAVLCISRCLGFDFIAPRPLATPATTCVLSWLASTSTTLPDAPARMGDAIVGVTDDSPTTVPTRGLTPPEHPKPTTVLLVSEALLATCASVGATFVAIIGGLLISRFIGIDAERSTKRAQLENLLAMEKEAQQLLVDRQGSVDESLVVRSLGSDRIQSYLRRIAEQSILPTAIELQRIQPALSDVPDDLLMRTAKTWVEEMKRALGHPSWSQVGNGTNWHDFRTKYRLPVQIEPVWLTVFRDRSSSHSELGHGESYNAELTVVQQQLTRLRDDARSTLELTRIQRKIAQDAAMRPADSGSVLRALLVLAVVTVGSVVVPILYMTPSKSAGVLTPEGITIIFLASIAGLFFYMAYEWRKVFARPSTRITRQDTED